VARKQVHVKLTDCCIRCVFAEVSTDLRDQLEHASDSSLSLSPFPEFLDVLLDDKARIKLELMDEPECFVAAILLALTGLASISAQSLS
jgi:hypothetical protein